MRLAVTFVGWFASHIVQNAALHEEVLVLGYIELMFDPDLWSPRPQIT